MLGKLKRKVQNRMVARCFREYSQQLNKQQHVYDEFMQKKGKELLEKYASKETMLTARHVKVSELKDILLSGERIQEDVLIVIRGEGILAPVATNVILSCFEEEPEIILFYPGEDICIGKAADLERFHKEGVKLSQRCYPNLKPIPSEETLFSYMYMGNVWAVRKNALQNLNFLKTEDADIFQYDLLLKIWEKNGSGAIKELPEILYHKFLSNEEDGKIISREEMETKLRVEDPFYGNEEKYDSIKEEACRRKGISMTMKRENGYGYQVYEIKEPLPLVSILIPSKDNPEVLKNCIAAIYDKSTYKNFEIIVVDNGSNEVNRQVIEAFRKQYPFEYIYHPMEFNYSAMNNMAAKQAKGSVLLLLNDDMEVVSADWLERMVGQVQREGVGAVGAKLLYPGTTLIQHVGVTNAVDGPVHKLLRKDDTQSYFYGRNKLVYNVLGVTGACLMVKKEYYDKLGGLKEDLRIAYNDVDLCLSLFEMGLRNVVRNDVVLYHHESLSRGADVMSEEKMQRLKKERDYLYKCHEWVYCTDPYVGANNTGGEEFGLYFDVDTDGEAPIAEATKDYSVYPAGLHVGIDRAEKEIVIKEGEEPFYVIQGFVVAPEADNCRYVFELVLQGEENKYVIPIVKKLRPNMSAGFPNARHLDLCGFMIKLPKDKLPKGTYHICVYGADRCSRQKLFQKTERFLHVE